MLEPLNRAVFTAHALAELAAHCHEQTQGLETGGILIGHHHNDGHVSVSEAGGPGPAATRTAVSFRRDAHHAQRLATAAYARDRSVWIGDWHTHPKGPVHPSAVDLRAYLDLLADPELNFDAFLAVIVIPSRAGPVLYPWAVTPASACPIGLWVERKATDLIGLRLRRSCARAGRHAGRG